MAGIHPVLAFLFPITLDGLILAGSLLILYFAVRGKRSGYGLFLTALGVIASIAGNVVISPNNLTYQILHATSPVVLFLSLESLMILLRARSRSAQEAAKQMEEEQKASASTEPIPESPSEPQNAVLSPRQAAKQDLSAIKEKELVKATQLIPAKSEPVASARITPVAEAVKTEEDTPVAPAPEVAVPSPVRAEPVAPAVKTPAVTVSPAAKTPVVTDADNPPSKRELIRELLTNNPEMDANEIVEIIGGDKKYVKKLIREERDKLTV